MLTTGLVWVAYAGVLLLLTGLLLVVMLALRYFKSKWVSGVATIQSVDVKTRFKLGIGRIKHFIINYEITHLNGRYFGADVIPLSEDYLKESEEIERFRSEYSKGNDILVFYNPHNPALNSLRREVPELKTAFNMFAGSIVLTVIAYAIHIAELISK